jgi:RyR domain
VINRRTIDSWIFSILAVIAVSLAWFGLGERFPELKTLSFFPERIAKSIQFFTSGAAGPPDHSMPLALTVARILGLIVSLWAVGKVVAHVFAEHIQEICIGLIRRHTVIAGQPPLVRTLIGDHRLNHRRIVLVDPNPLDVFASAFYGKRPLAVRGDPALRETLFESGIRRASRLFLLFSDDQRNIDVAVAAWEIVRKSRSGALTCHLHIGDRRLTEILEKADFFLDDRFRLRFFNLTDLTVRKLLTMHPIEDHPEYNPDAAKTVIHVFIFGLGEMGESLVLQIAKIAHFGTRKPTRVTIVDRDCDRCKERLLSRYPQLPDILDLRFVSFDAALGNVVNLEILRKQAFEIKVIFIAFDNDSLCLNAALELQRADPERFLKIYVRKSTGGGVARLIELREAEPGRPTFHFFGALDDLCTIEMIERGSLDSMAKALHKAYQRKWSKDGVAQEATLTHVPWEELPEELKESNRRHADHIAVKARQIGCCVKRGKPDSSFQLSAEEIEKLAEIEHRRWMADRRLNGWSYGPTRDSRLKRHPMLVEWESLPEAERDKDRDFIREIPAILESAGFVIDRPTLHHSQVLTNV